MSAPLSCQELGAYRDALERCRGAAVAAADRAVREIMAKNAAVLARIDAAFAELEPRPGEPACEHWRRIEAAFAQLDSDTTTFEGE